VAGWVGKGGRLIEPEDQSIYSTTSGRD
jgi:hypothetical protein